MANANFRGFLIVDGSKNTLLIPKEDVVGRNVVGRNLSMDELISKHIHEAKRHRTQAELNKDIALYLKCEYTPGNGLHE